MMREQLDATFSETHVGVCWAVNEAAQLADQDLMDYLNDDMHCLPGWDRAAATPAWWWPTVAIQSQSVSTAGPR